MKFSKEITDLNELCSRLVAEKASVESLRAEAREKITSFMGNLPDGCTYVPAREISVKDYRKASEEDGFVVRYNDGEEICNGVVYALDWKENRLFAVLYTNMYEEPFYEEQLTDVALEDVENVEILIKFLESCAGRQEEM